MQCVGGLAQAVPCVPRSLSTRNAVKKCNSGNSAIRGRQLSGGQKFHRVRVPGQLRISAIAEAEKTARQDGIIVNISNDVDPDYTVIQVQATNRGGLLNAITQTFRDLGLDVGKAEVDAKDGLIDDRFFVTQNGGKKVSDSVDLDNIKNCLDLVLRSKGAPKTKRPRFAPPSEDTKDELLYDLMDTYIKSDVLSIQESIVHHVEYTLARSRIRFNYSEAYQAVAYSLRDRLIESWNDTNNYFREVDPKRVYYLSMEYLMGRSLLNSVFNLNVSNQYSEALQELGYDMEKLLVEERDAALGNGGLGRLAACFLDSMATTNQPAWGYGIRYQYGMFRQSIVDGHQHEQPDYWLMFGNPWEIERVNVQYPIKFYGHVSVIEENGRQVFRWNAGEQVTATAYDNPIPGFDTNNTINLRLWAAKPDKEFDLQAFNTGDYVQAILSKQRAETISAVLYPDDRTYKGKELRLKQQHFFVSASVQDVVRRYVEKHDGFDLFTEKVAFQLNDTHPTIAVPELMRVLMDEYKLGWTKSWDITTKVFSFTNHTVMPEALEKWPVSLFEKLLPRHMQIVYDINWRFLQQMRGMLGDDWKRISRMSIIEDQANGEKTVKMAVLAVIASHTVNGVAAIHSEIIKDTIFKDFYEIWPEKFQNKTNGVTQRRWLAFCNPGLRQLLTDTLGNTEWINKDLYQLQKLREFAEDPAFQEKWRNVKQIAKVKSINWLKQATGVNISENAMLDVQVKRIHEYKRQLLNILGIIYRYDQIKKMSPEERKNVVARVCVIGGKAAPGYEMAKRIIKLVCAVGDKINNDPEIGDLLKLVFLPDYNVSAAEIVIPGTELSQHISTAGTEASGTSNMKFTMNGSLIIGTMDGANIEIGQEIGWENMFIFGAKADQVDSLRLQRKNLKPDPRFVHVTNMIRNGLFGYADLFQPLLDSLDGSIGGDHYLVANDFPGYIETQEKVDEAYKDKERWTKMSIMCTAGSGFFSSDRTIKEYAKDIWKIDPTPVPGIKMSPL